MLFLTMTILMTVIEYIAGYLSLKINKVRLWDYTDQWGNINGIICPKFSLFWGILGAVYYFLSIRTSSALWTGSAAIWHFPSSSACFSVCLPSMLRTPCRSCPS